MINCTNNQCMHTFHRRAYRQVPRGKDNESDPKVFKQRPELHFAILHNMPTGIKGKVKFGTPFHSRFIMNANEGTQV